MAKVQMNVWVEDVEREALRAAASERGVSLGELVRQLAGQLLPPSSEARDLGELRVRVAGLESQGEDFEQRLSRIEELASGASF